MASNDRTSDPQQQYQNLGRVSIKNSSSRKCTETGQTAVNYEPAIAPLQFKDRRLNPSPTD
ncbi:MAG: hypothetical protein AAGD25_02380 [Cyanobacteria bacterium P01_F01_bin.150]